MKLSVIIPVYNEENTVKEIIDKVKLAKLPTGFVKEIIVVNDSSTDSTKKIISKIKGIRVFHHKTNKGKGAAVRTGISKSKGGLLIIQDADLEYNPDDYRKLLMPIINDKARVVYGTRLKDYPLILFGKNKTPMPFHLIANKILTWSTNILYLSSLTDMETCYKIFDMDLVKSLDLTSDGFDIEAELTAKVLKLKVRIHEVPIKVTPRSYGEGKKISSKDGIIALWTLLKYRF